MIINEHMITALIIISYCINLFLSILIPSYYFNFFNDPVRNIEPDIMQPMPHKQVYITLKDNKILSKSDKPDSEASCNIICKFLKLMMLKIIVINIKIRLNIIRKMEARLKLISLDCFLLFMEISFLNS